MRNFADKICRGNQNTFHILSENRAFCDVVGKYGKARQATDNNVIRRMRVACWITKVTDTFRICNTYCFSTTTVVTRKSLSATLYVLTLPVLLISEIYGVPTFGYLIRDFSKYVFGNAV